MTEPKPFIYGEKENAILQAERNYEQNFKRIVESNVYNELHSPPKYNMQAMTFYARSSEEMFKKVEEWLIAKYTLNLHKPTKKKWWRFWNE